jgi:hypothetical protein
MGALSPDCIQGSFENVGKALDTSAGVGGAHYSRPGGRRYILACQSIPQGLKPALILSDLRHGCLAVPFQNIDVFRSSLAAISRLATNWLQPKPVED